MIGTIVFAVFTTLCVFWIVLSALTIFLMIKYNGLSIVVWTIIAIYFIITVPIFISGYTTLLGTEIDWEGVLPRLFIE